ncbi:Guanosine-5'-triphosphate,3'-diphosphate pyrophosphatase [Rhizobium rhizogenes]|uniref:Guanosine-5'-triphosphate,3'-diphosphate pyrophosphatase n=1 Tax=Rhizobium rhizogenes TaxID=359 RepID=A0AAN1ZZP2_RHIRH|nr:MULTISPECIES: Ppx/GppA phosphatase family protein [Rhizobium/Agrobacterium group]MCZ7441732.1 Ppx/GppA phosphatase family protein [Rhizobium rhizogenes]NSZ78058.1 Ppx/GppA family phosphatase [Agrobacterium tumefaciens]OAM64941.1 exopolyphosphatase [Rhizobium rhizogenes]CAD0210268.1 Guanosine-5'-triphosphate,3'-diphosphate pyrophosphatase [Rhizobium rhizogenes]
MKASSIASTLVRGEMDKTVIDPGNGPKPSDQGASVANKGKAKRSRRGKKHKRDGKPRDAAVLSHDVAADVPAGSSYVSALEPDAEPRKRKRRRRSRGKGAASQQAAPAASVQVQASTENDATNPSSVPPGGGRKSRNRKRGHRDPRGRDPQGRPLVSTHAPRHVGKQGGRANGTHPESHRPQSEISARHSGRQHEPGQEPPADMYAALDLGTNNCRLLIAQPTRPGQFRVVDAFSRIVRLGEGLVSSGRLSDDAMDRAVEALKVCSAKLSGRPIRRMRLIATEACRAATNGEEFLARVTRETGLKLEIISRETEARLAVSGCASLVGREARSVVLFDIGGGSSEIAVIKVGENRSNRLANHITHWTSLPVGVVTLSERHGGRDVTPDVFAAMVREVEGLLDAFHCPPLAPQTHHEDFHLIGTSGTVTTLAGVHLDLPRYDRRKVDGLWLSDAEVTAMQDKLLAWDFAGRAANACIGPDRADLVLAGCAILEAIRRRWPARRMRVADRGLREGLLTDMMADDGAWRRNRIRRMQMIRQDRTEGLT